VSLLHLAGDTRFPVATGTEKLDDWLRQLVHEGGSDLLLVAGVPASIRVDGKLRRIGAQPLVGTEIEAAILPALSAYGLQLYQRSLIADSSYAVKSLGRFRINLHHERGSAAAAVRALPPRVPELSELRLPDEIAALAQVQRGLIIVGGATGSGKTTTVAALVNEINREQARHIVTIEDPVEYEHAHMRGVVEQVEIGIDAADFPIALRAALRQVPDVIVVGEMRDPETAHIALAAAETGHLVLTTLHTTDVISTVSRIADSFPPERQNTIRQEMAMALSAVMTQKLLRTKSGGLIPAAELLMVSYGARQHIRRNALQHLHQEITSTRRLGSITLEQSLVSLVVQGEISREDALLAAIHPEDLEGSLKVKGL
jgi:twitching motility protein PilT